MDAETKVWYLSRTVWGGILAIAASVLNLAGIEISGADQAELADKMTALMAAAGGIVAVAGRLAASRRLLKGGGWSRGIHRHIHLPFSVVALILTPRC